MNIADELERLRSLHDSGALSEEEFARAKARVLEKSSDLHDASAAAPLSSLHRLRRSQSDRVLGGVCAGLGHYTGMPSWVWRLLFCVAVFGFGFGALLYCLLWIFIPVEA